MNIDTLRGLWKRSKKNPLTRAVFHRALYWVVPYTGSVSPQILEVGPGLARLQIRDKRSVRNHLNSVHAIALANVGEFSTGLALLFSLGSDRRTILQSLNIVYLKKGRGTLTATCKMDEGALKALLESPLTSRREEVLQSQIKDAQGELIATVTAKWLVGPSRS